MDSKYSGYLHSAKSSAGAAYKAAVEHKGQPTVILAKTVKGYGMGEAGEAQMISHQAKKMNVDALKQLTAGAGAG